MGKVINLFLCVGLILIKLGLLKEVMIIGLFLEIKLDLKTRKNMMMKLDLIEYY